MSWGLRALQIFFICLFNYLLFGYSDQFVFCSSVWYSWVNGTCRDPEGGQEQWRRGQAAVFIRSFSLKNHLQSLRYLQRLDQFCRVSPCGGWAACVLAASVQVSVVFGRSFVPSLTVSCHTYLACVKLNSSSLLSVGPQVLFSDLTFFFFKGKDKPDLFLSHKGLTLT